MKIFTHDIFDALIKGHFETIKNYIEKGKTLSDFAITLPAMYGHIHILEYFFEKNIHVLQTSAFQWACYYGRYDVVKFLFEKGAKINDIREHTALKASCLNGDIRIVKFLFEHGADIKTNDYCALHAASQRGHLEVVKFLVEKGADIHSLKDFAFRWACRFGHLQVAKYLFQKGALISTHNNYAIKWSMRENHFEIVKFLVDKGVDSSLVLGKFKRYVDFCKKMENKRQIWAVNKIYFWWIPICYDVNRECGKRMMERSWNRVEEMYEKKN